MLGFLEEETSKPRDRVFSYLEDFPSVTYEVTRKTKSFFVASTKIKVLNGGSSLEEDIQTFIKQNRKIRPNEEENPILQNYVSDMDVRAIDRISTKNSLSNKKYMFEQKYVMRLFKERFHVTIPTHRNTS